MPRYIDQDELLKKFPQYSKAWSAIYLAPTADVAPRSEVEGEWIGADICAEDMYCSVCGGIAPVDCEKEAFYKSNYCPNCGAKMKGV